MFVIFTDDIFPAACQKNDKQCNRNALDITSVDGKEYGVPFRYDGSSIYYNIDMLKAAGYDAFPETWDEMVEMSKKLSKDGVYGFVPD